MRSLNPELTPHVLSVVGGIFSDRKANWSADALQEDEIYHAIEMHGIAPVIYYVIRKTGDINQWPAGLVKKLDYIAKQEVATELARDLELKKVLTSMQEANIQPILIKGAPLSYTLYPEHGLRPRCDTDMLIARPDRARVTDLFKALGYESYFDIADSGIGSQTTFVSKNTGGVSHAFDIHRNINNNSQRFSDQLSYDALIKDTQAVSVLGENARTLTEVDALLLACMHRAGHLSGDGERLIWLYDIHLLAGKLTEKDFRSFVIKSGELQVTAISADALKAAQQWFNTKLPDGVISDLKSSSRYEPSQRFLNVENSSSIKNHAMIDLEEMSSAGGKIGYILSKVFPPVSYMMWRYRLKHMALLPVYYLYRLMFGIYIFLKT